MDEEHARYEAKMQQLWDAFVSEYRSGVPSLKAEIAAIANRRAATDKVRWTPMRGGVRESPVAPAVRLTCAILAPVVELYTTSARESLLGYAGTRKGAGTTPMLWSARSVTPGFIRAPTEGSRRVP